MSSYKPKQVVMTVEEALNWFYNDIEELANECREVVDNAPEGLQQSQRIITMEESADTLENLQLPNGVDGLPKECADVTVKFITAVPKARSRQASRAVRCSNAVAGAQAAVEALRTWIDGKETESDEATIDIVSEVTDLCNEVEDHIGQAEGCEFPGMRS